MQTVWGKTGARAVAGASEDLLGSLERSDDDATRTATEHLDRLVEAAGRSHFSALGVAIRT